ncbi:VOC family protein [Mixta gaviniae]|uniref:Glyoxalase n=1 Tax=Mixta gaviniae TaxID=665914 RepID=A0A1X1DIQ4_9GAMM|nr:VOC family protein [Mixta gaviniae]AUX93034.1 glyoxalase [Mixta gaviniae]ORM76539.1 hypothetical protein HA44_15325 [Mixta gaviniae]
MQLRIARPVNDLHRSQQLYCQGMGMQLLGEFSDHQGHSGIMLGYAGESWHLEFTHCLHHPAAPASTAEDLLVLYLPEEAVWLARCEAMQAAGFRTITPFNPYWETAARTFIDEDGYRTVIRLGSWPAVS